MNAEAVLFWVFATCIVVSAGLVIASTNPVSSAMALVATFFFLAGTYVLLLAHTLAILQVLVYAGAIMVLFLFVIMLLSLTENTPARSSFSFSKVVGGGSAAALLGLLAGVMYRLQITPAAIPNLAAGSPPFGSLERIGMLVYTQYLLPFEALSLLLLVAIVGAVVVAKSRI